MRADDFSPAELMLAQLRREQPDEPGNSANGFPRPLGAVPFPPEFPRASDDESIPYLIRYRLEARPLFFDWLRDRLNGVEFADATDVRKCAKLRAEDEMNRPLKEFELIVLNSVSRDFFYARTAGRAAGVLR
jgi:hypothetical protein